MERITVHLAASSKLSKSEASCGSLNPAEVLEPTFKVLPITCFVLTILVLLYRVTLYAFR